MQLASKDLRRFNRKVDDSGACHEWTGATNRDGYGRFWVNGRHHLAHRAAYAIAHSHAPEVVRHTCDNPSCVNPKHLRGGTQADNIEDRQRRDRQAKGSQNGRSKLTAEDVRELRRRKKETDATYKELAQECGVSHYTVKDAVLGNTWSHV